MRVAIIRPEDPPSPVDTCIVIDVLRATTTAAVLCSRLGELRVARSPADLTSLPPHAPGYALFSELSGIESDLQRFDNSPNLARTAELAGRMPVLVTTNGTLAVGHAAGMASEIVLASFVNLSAVAAYVTRARSASVAILPAGNITKQQRCSEDDACADAILAQLTGDDTFDIAARLAACRDDPRILRRCANEPGLQADLDVCLSVDTVAVVPRVIGEPDRRWYTAVAA